VVGKQQILIVKNFLVYNRYVMGNHRSKTANIRGFHPARNTLFQTSKLIARVCKASTTHDRTCGDSLKRFLLFCV
jgi:hypothetical protein